MSYLFVQFQHEKKRPLGFRGGFEANMLCYQLGFNEFEIYHSIVPWLIMGKRLGLNMEELLGCPIEPDSAQWWVDLMNMIAYRKGFGDLLSEGLFRTIQTLGQKEYGDPVHTGPSVMNGLAPEHNGPIDMQGGWGYNSRELQWEMPLPMALFSGLKWLIDTRDPHHNKWFDPTGKLELALFEEEDPYLSDIGLKLAHHYSIRGFLIDSLTLCWQFPLRNQVPSAHYPVLALDAEARLYSAATGIETSEQELDRIGDRIQNIDRAIQIRNNDRTAQMEWDAIVPNLKKNPDFEEDRFKVMTENWYEWLGWDKKTGWPTRTTLEDLDLKDVADDLEAIGKLPE